MLQIKNISKQYKTGDLIQDALKDVSLNLRDNEFVSILGPSGSGKTTLLNIIGGLDRYDSGDLIINNVSTVEYEDRDWDSYRNHTIGFVFQSYNLIPHQTVLANVELALTIGGISKKERRNRALKALEEVGLREQAHKKPNQMSGGQMQRVAIARALVNNPDILLADEPTGALDTETSVQVMELLKKVANDRLVIMVTHNPELAEEYSTRIVRLKDGEIIDDTDPFVPEQEKIASPEHRNLGKASMSIMTALSLSFNNLLTKKGRTILTAFAGSIGIIGIALILSLSTGFQNYIDQIQEDTLTSYPLTLTAETADTTSMLLSMVSESGGAKEDDVVKEQKFISSMLTSIGKNDLSLFKEHLERNAKTVDELVSIVEYQYNITPLIYTVNSEEKITQLNPSTVLTSMGMSSSMSSMTPISTAIFNEMLDDRATLESQYDVLAGRWPKEFNEAILVLSEPNAIPDMLVYGLGLRDENELIDMMAKLMAGEQVEESSEALQFSYEDLMNLPLKLVDATATYKYNAEYNIYEDMTKDVTFMQKVYDEAVDLKIVGIVCANENSTSSVLSPGIAYTKELTEYVIEKASESEIVQKQKTSREVDIFSGKRFDDKSEEAGLDFEDMISIDTDMLSSAFGMEVSEQDIANMTQGYMTEISSSITTDTKGAEEVFSNTLVSFTTDMLNDYIEENLIPMIHVASMKMSDVENVVNTFMNLETTQQTLTVLETNYVVPKATFQSMYTELLKGFLQGYIQVATLEPDAEDPSAYLTKDSVQTIVASCVAQEAVTVMVKQIGAAMTEAVMQKNILTKVGELSAALMGTLANSFNVDQDKIAGAFKFDMSEEELTRIMTTMSASNVEKNADTNLTSLGYQDINDPSSISLYFVDFEAKEKFIDFLEDYNKKMEKEDEEKVINYADITGLLMSSVKTIVDSVSYVLIAFVSISLIVSSIMIGIITYISVLERTKEIGVLRAIGASKKNISSIFNAETFIVGLFAGLLGIAITILLNMPINSIIHSLTDNTAINAVLPTNSAIILVVLSVILTLIGGLIPSKQAAKKDPVLALRSE